MSNSGSSTKSSGDRDISPAKCPNDEDNTLDMGIADLYKDKDLLWGLTVITSNSTFKAMSSCCGSNEATVFQDCNAICELPEELREEMRDREESAQAVLVDCLRDNLPSGEEIGSVAGSSLEDLEKLEGGKDSEDPDNLSVSLKGMGPNIPALYLLLLVVLFFQRR